MSELAERARRRQWKPADATVGRPSPNGFLSTRVVGSYSRESAPPNHLSVAGSQSPTVANQRSQVVDRCEIRSCRICCGWRLFFFFSKPRGRARQLFRVVSPLPVYLPCRPPSQTRLSPSCTPAATSPWLRSIFFLFFVSPVIRPFTPCGCTFSGRSLPLPLSLGRSLLLHVAVCHGRRHRRHRHHHRHRHHPYNNTM